MSATALGTSQRSILDRLKRSGRSTVPELAADLGLNVETVREHVRALAGLLLVRRDGTRSTGPGRPEVLYALTPEADEHFPRRDGEVLRDLASHLLKTGNSRILMDFFRQSSGGRSVRARVRRHKGRARLEEVARIFSERGFMAEVHDDAGVPCLRLCHCPIRDLVHATRIPCVAEIETIQDLLGEKLARTSYLPAGDASCSYTLESLAPSRTRLSRGKA